ncbi:AAA family ATPase [Photobacterium damselae]|uniref:AAA family ATPase n=1 Tax=Photobacterium damselae TaxID=38293 RepID=UPI000D054289|nr:AAA family ATPase [Photobacterium damselae]NVO72999.1 ATP-binding protein [Photobacterium damselae subsp. damselae]PSB85819.1 chromosome segregation protein SMC [Photobacterium damselae subsp. damselae]SPY30134.1 Uncharacterised protein [Photobacterium damselae]
MLLELSVRNFRNFNDWFNFSLKTIKNYEFNCEVISNDIVKHSIVYGLNGGGKSNLGLAILDLTNHLNDSWIMPALKINYLNASSSKDIAEFKYKFIFDGSLVEYSYGKSDCQTTVYEELIIDGQSCASIDRNVSPIAIFNLEGAENLKSNLENTSISVVKYLKSNSVLEDNKINNVFNKFVSFVEGMVFFRTLHRNADFCGQALDTRRLSEEIISLDKVDDFESFLNDAGITCKLKVVGLDTEKRIEFDFGERSIEFSLVASTGTLSLGIFYYWWLKLSSDKLTFAYIDEFDAYYHYELSKLIVKKLSAISCQTVLTTHNTGIMTNDLLRPDCYFLLHEKQYRLYELVNKDLRKSHNLEKIFKGLK